MFLTAFVRMVDDLTSLGVKANEIDADVDDSKLELYISLRADLEVDSVSMDSYLILCLI